MSFLEAAKSVRGRKGVPNGREKVESIRERETRGLKDAKDATAWLTQGLHVGESLGAGFNGSLPTHTYWTTAFAVGLSVRIPSLTGR